MSSKRKGSADAIIKRKEENQNGLAVILEMSLLKEDEGQRKVLLGINHIIRQIVSHPSGDLSRKEVKMINHLGEEVEVAEEEEVGEMEKGVLDVVVEEVRRAMAIIIIMREPKAIEMTGVMIGPMIGVMTGTSLKITGVMKHQPIQRDQGDVVGAVEEGVVEEVVVPVVLILAEAAVEVESKYH